MNLCETINTCHPTLGPGDRPLLGLDLGGELSQFAFIPRKLSAQLRAGRIISLTGGEIYIS